MSFNRKMVGTLHLPLLTVASTIFRPLLEARYRSRRTPSCSWAKEVDCIKREEGDLQVLGVALAVDPRRRQFLVVFCAMDSTRPKRICLWVFLLGLVPFFGVVLLLWRRNACLAGGCAGRLVVWWWFYL